MKTIVYLPTAKLDLSKQKFSIQENNAKVSDSQFTKIIFPFSLPVSEEILNSIGDIINHAATDVETVIDCKLEHEGRVHDAKLEILGNEGLYAEAQIDYGFDELPNWSKKLSELPLENFSVPDIHTYAPTVLNKKYPEVNFNFPRIYNKKYDPTTEVWDAFDGFLNDMKQDMTEMRRNYIDGVGNIFNVNIIHPMPYILHVLKIGFRDAGFELKGDILTDADLYYRTIYSGTDYFTSKQQRRFDFNIKASQADELLLETGPDDYAIYERHITLEKTGTYKIAGMLKFWKAKKMFANYQISLNGQKLWQKRTNSSKADYMLDIPINFEFAVNQENSVLTFYAKKQYHPDWDFQLADLLVTSSVLEDISNAELGEDSGFVTNRNEVNLKNAVPDMTFGDFVNKICNWFNYAMIPIEKTIYMNRLSLEKYFEPKDFRKYEAKRPKRVPKKNVSYLLKFPELDRKVDSVFYDAKGFKLNGEEIADTKVIDIDGYCLPVYMPKPNSYSTAVVQTDSTTMLQLVYYDGLTDGTNNAKNPAGCHFPELFYKNWENWLKRRLECYEYTWKFTIPIEEMANYSINDYIYCYDNIHLIKTLNKDKVSETTYEVEIITETIR